MKAKYQKTLAVPAGQRKKAAVSFVESGRLTPVKTPKSLTPVGKTSKK